MVLSPIPQTERKARPCGGTRKPLPTQCDLLHQQRASPLRRPDPPRRRRLDESSRKDHQPLHDVRYRGETGAWRASSRSAPPPGSDLLAQLDPHDDHDDVLKAVDADMDPEVRRVRNVAIASFHDEARGAMALAIPA